jgi:5-methylcytosine-specific restriction endonuclease McrA
VTLTTCLSCGRVCRGPRCPTCHGARVRAYDATHRGTFYQSPEWRALAATVRSGATRCHWCGRVTRRLVADHVLPIALRPDLALDPANVVPACVSCNNRRGSSGRAITTDRRGVAP